MAQAEDSAVAILRSYIQIRTDHPSPDYAAATKFLQSQAESIGLQFSCTECTPGKPVLVLTWPGSSPQLSSVLLNSHTDVVPVSEEHWTYPPFSAYKDSKGNIYGRGTQDMKSVGIQYLEAIRRLMKAERPHTRTVHVSFVPDEEIGGHDGLAKFVLTSKFKEMNVGFGLDEGLASPSDEVDIFYAERNEYWFEVHCPGDPGHGSRFVENTAAEKARYMINKMLDYREVQRKRLEENSDLSLGDVNTINLTMMNGGVQANVVPDKLILTFDVRITPTSDLKEFEDMIRQWMSEAGPGLEMIFIQKMMDQSITSVDESDMWYGPLKKAFDKNGLKVKPKIMSAGTDARCVREAGIPAIGFSPMPMTPVLLHDHDEFINEDIFLKGIETYMDVIENLTNV